MKLLNQDNLSGEGENLPPSHYAVCMKEKYDVDTFECRQGFFSYTAREIFFITEIYVDKKYLGASRMLMRKWEEIARSKNYKSVFLSFSLSAKNFEKSLQHSLAVGFKFFKIENNQIYLTKEI